MHESKEYCIRKKRFEYKVRWLANCSLGAPLICRRLQAVHRGVPSFSCAGQNLHDSEQCIQAGMRHLCCNARSSCHTCC